MPLLKWSSGSSWLSFLLEITWDSHGRVTAVTNSSFSAPKDGWNSCLVLRGPWNIALSAGGRQQSSGENNGAARQASGASPYLQWRCAIGTTPVLS